MPNLSLPDLAWTHHALTSPARSSGIVSAADTIVNWPTTDTGVSEIYS